MNSLQSVPENARNTPISITFQLRGRGWAASALAGRLWVRLGAVLLLLMLGGMQARGQADVYVDSPSDFDPPNPRPGQRVTWNSAGGNQVSGLVYGTNAFGRIADAVAAVERGGTVHLAPGEFADGGEVKITKSLTLHGEGQDVTAVTGQNSYRVFQVTGRTTEVTFDSLTVCDGLAEDDDTIAASPGEDIRRLKSAARGSRRSPAAEAAKSDGRRTGPPPSSP